MKDPGNRKVLLSCGCWVTVPAKAVKVCCPDHAPEEAEDAAYEGSVGEPTDPPAMSCCGATKRTGRSDYDPCWNCGAI